VNNSGWRMGQNPHFPAFSNYSRVINTAFFVNNSVNMISLSEYAFVIICSQFIERTEMSGGGQQIDGERLKDNPR
jgi:hypothetical protein